MTTAEEQTRGYELILFAFCVRNQLVLPTLTHDYDDNFTNYFYRNDTAINLCIPDTPHLRQFSTVCGMNDIVWFGHNTDPVQLVSMHEVSFSLQQALAPAPAA